MDTLTATTTEVLGDLKEAPRYELSINRKMKGKDKNAKPTAYAFQQSHKVENWEKVSWTLQELADYVAEGGVWRPSINTFGKSDDGVEYLELLALDFDGPGERERYTSFEESVGIIYRTQSWAPEDPQKMHKQRLVFALSRRVTPSEYKLIYKAMLAQFKSADTSCANPSRVFFGSNLPATLVKEVTLDVEKTLRFGEDFLQKKKAKAKQEKAAAASAVKATSVKRIPYYETEMDACLDTFGADYETLKEDSTKAEELLEDLYCLHKHNFSSRTPDIDDAILKFEGCNPFSKTDSTGSSFVVTLFDHKDESGEYVNRCVTLWSDRSGNYKNSFSGESGGTHMEYWFALHPDFTQKGWEKHRANYLLSFLIHKSRVCSYKKWGSTALIARVHQVYGKRLQWDSLSDSIILDGKPYSWKCPAVDFEILMGNYTYYSNDTVKQVLTKAARLNEVNPWLDEVKGAYAKYKPNQKLWDTLLSFMFSVSELDPAYDMKLKQLQNHLIASVARSVYPGMRYDTVLVLTGKQGTGKSTFFNWLFGKYTSEGIKPNGDDKDNVMAYIPLIAVQLGELGQYLRETDIEQFKRWITQLFDALRKPYGYEVETIYRRFVICATSNDTNCLPNDPTGNRRFAVIPVVETLFSKPASKSELKMREELRGILLATIWEKFLALDTGKQCDMEQELSLEARYWKMAAKDNSQYTPANMALDALEDLLDSKIGIDVIRNPEKRIYYIPTTALYQLMDKPSTKREQMQIIANMSLLGWKKEQLWLKQQGNISRNVTCFYIDVDTWLNRNTQEQDSSEPISSSLNKLLSVVSDDPTRVTAPQPKAPALTEQDVQEPVMINPVVIKPKAPAPLPAPEAPAPLFVPAPLPATAPLCEAPAFLGWVKDNLGSLKPEDPDQEIENAPDDEGVREPIVITEEEIQAMQRVEAMLQAKAPVQPKAKTKLTKEERFQRAVAQAKRSSDSGPEIQAS